MEWPLARLQSALVVHRNDVGNIFIPSLLTRHHSPRARRPPPPALAAMSVSASEIEEVRAALERSKLEAAREKARAAAYADEIRALKAANLAAHRKDEHEEENVTNALVKKLERVNAEKRDMLMRVEQEEEFITNALQKRLDRVVREKLDLEARMAREHARTETNEKKLGALTEELSALARQKVDLERALEAEQECIVNKLTKQTAGLAKEREALRAEREALRRQVETLLRRVFLTPVPIRPRSRCERRFLRTFSPDVYLSPPLGFDRRPRRLSTPTDAFELHPDVVLRTERPSQRQGAAGAREDLAREHDGGGGGAHREPPAVAAAGDVPAEPVLGAQARGGRVADAVGRERERDLGRRNRRARARPRRGIVALRAPRGRVAAPRREPGPRRRRARDGGPGRRILWVVPRRSAALRLARAVGAGDVRVGVQRQTAEERRVVRRLRRHERDGVDVPGFDRDVDDDEERERRGLARGRREERRRRRRRRRRREAWPRGGGGRRVGARRDFDLAREHAARVRVRGRDADQHAEKRAQRGGREMTRR